MITALALCCLLPLVDPLQHLGIVPPRKHSLLQSPSRSSRRRAVLSCAQLSIWHDFNSTSRPGDAQPCSRPRSRAFRRPRNFPRSRKRKRFSRRWRDELIEGAGRLPSLAQLPSPPSTCYGSHRGTSCVRHSQARIYPLNSQVAPLTIRPPNPQRIHLHQAAHPDSTAKSSLHPSHPHLVSIADVPKPP